jgi:multiple antibiotic resistance protein
MGDTVATVIRIAMLAFAALLPLINPPGLAPIFLSMTPGASDPTRTTIARRIAQTSFVLLVGAMLVGSYVLIFFGLSLAVVKMAGGLLVIASAWHLISAEQTPDSTIATASSMSAEHIATTSFYPLTFPLTIGPGAISVAVTLGAGIRDHDVPPLAAILGAMAGVVMVSAAIYLSFRFASRLIRVLGRTGTVVLLRLSAFILLSIGVQILCDGLIERFGLLQASN